MDSTRRQFLSTFMGAGSLGLAALATGLPIALLVNPRRALADPPASSCLNAGAAQYLILSTSGSGDPLNANAPGSYVTSGSNSVVHPNDPTMAGTQYMVGSQRITGAQYWSTLGNPGASTPADPGHGTQGAAATAALARTSFFHHATYTNSHPNEFKVLELMGSTTASESIPSIYSKYLQGCLGSIQAEPIVLAGTTGIVSFNGRPIPSLAPTGLADTLGALAPPGSLPTSQNNLRALVTSLTAATPGHMATLRDTHLDNINAILRSSGTPAQRAYVDALVTSRDQARAIPTNLLSMLTSISDNGASGQCAAAIALIKMNISPVIVISIPFGGDNHSDDSLMQREQPQTVAGIDQIGLLLQGLAANGLSEKVTFASLNVFGRTPSSQGTIGRGHWANHHVGIINSSRTQGGVVGGMTWSATAGDFVAGNIDPTTGAMADAGTIGASTGSLQAYARTLGATLGVPSAVLDANITGGATVAAALTPAARA